MTLFFTGCRLESAPTIACVTFLKKHAKGTKLRASAKNKEQGEGVGERPPPPSSSPLPTSPQFFAQRQARYFACLFDKDFHYVSHYTSSPVFTCHASISTSTSMKETYALVRTARQNKTSFFSLQTFSPAFWLCN